SMKDISEELATAFAEAVVSECEMSAIPATDPVIQKILEVPEAGVTMGKQGVGCRGIGDFFVHKQLANIAGTSTVPVLGPDSLDDAGVVTPGEEMQDCKGSDMLIVTKMEGMHSRLSDFPFIAGFHVTRAALRDLYVKGARPVAITVDLHLGDDGDVGKLYDFMAGVSTVAELTRTPITAGSTLRIGGDMVIGTRLTGGIGAVGVATRLLARRNILPGDAVIMTEGAGGGTIATTAIYSGNPDVCIETLNVKFLDACELILASELVQEIHTMCDVTNGGLRGDLYEIIYEAQTGVQINEGLVEDLINPQVLALLKQRGIDPFGVSLDALLLFAPQDVAQPIIDLLAQRSVKACQIGTVTDTGVVIFESRDGETRVVPKFRESAYTKVKEVVGEEAPADATAIEERLKASLEAAKQKRTDILEYIQANRKEAI
ncbi:MAG TPA: AIR synthase-related protein, partial [Candidatus Lokiarchaeia archaeon]|nr:AIR synthase-related protein [Candidatus Lokiarchaeia archaeon]